MKKTILFLVVAAVCLAFAAPLFAEATAEKGPMKVGVFVPGVAAGSPLYEQLVSGANKVAAEFPNVTIKVSVNANPATSIQGSRLRAGETGPALAAVTSASRTGS